MLSADTDDPDDFTLQMEAAEIRNNKLTTLTMKKIHTFLAGTTLGSDETFVKKLTKRGAKVTPLEESDVTIVFCPIVSRYETDIDSALSSASEQGCKKMILVTMHHTFNENYTLPNHRELGNSDVILHVDCLFFETKGFLKCRCNKKAVEEVREKLSLRKTRIAKLFKRMTSKNNKKSKKT